MNKGQCSYKDAETLKPAPKKKVGPVSVAPCGNRARAAAVAAAAAIGAGIHRRTDLMHSAVEAVRALGEKGGSSFRAIVKFVRQALRLDPGVRLRLAVKRAVAAGRLLRVGRLYRLPCSDSDESSSDSDDDASGTERLGLAVNGNLAGRAGQKVGASHGGRRTACNATVRGSLGSEVFGASDLGAQHEYV